MRFAAKENCFRRRKISRLIHIKERIEGFHGPIDNGVGIALQKMIDFASILLDQRMAQILSDCDWPERNQWMRPPA